MKILANAPLLYLRPNSKFADWSKSRLGKKKALPLHQNKK